MTASLAVIWWRDIPAQVVAREGRLSHKVVLADRFQEAIDRAAMRAGLADTEAYLDQWRRHERPCTGDLQAEAEAEAKLLDEAYPSGRLTALAAAGGRAPEE